MTVLHPTSDKSQAQTVRATISLMRRRHSTRGAGLSRGCSRSSELSESRNPIGLQCTLPEIQHEEPPSNHPSRCTSSTSVLPANLSRGVLDRYLDLRRIIHALKNQVSRVRSQCDSEQRQLFNTLPQQLESALELATSLHHIVEYDRPIVAESHPSKLQQQCAKSLRDAEVQNHVNCHIAQELSCLESSLLRWEEDLDATLTSLCSTHEFDTKVDEDIQDYSETSELGSSELPPLLQNFYVRSGDVGIHEDRLEELEIEREHDLARRAFLPDRGEPLDVGDDDAACKQYEQQRATILSELAKAQYDVGVLSQACEAVGIDTEARRYVCSSDGRSQDESAWPLENVAADVQLSPFAPPRSRVHGRGTISPPAASRTPCDSWRVRRSVQNWLQKTDSA